MNYLCVYILECADKTYYTGVTNDLERRLLEHQNGENSGSYTYSRRPVKLMWYSEDMSPDQAIELEKQIKGWRRSKKEALFKEDWSEISRLARKRK